MDLNFEKMNGLIPAIIQDNSTSKVLMLGFMNEEAYRKTVETGKVTFFSRTKNRLWTKGEESGNFLNVVSIKEDCDKDTLLIKVNPAGPVCHTGTDTCWGEENKEDIMFLKELQDFIDKRHEEMPAGSYTTSLFRTANGKVIEIQHNVMTPQPYNRLYQLTGSKGFANKYPVEGYALDAAQLTASGVQPKVDDLNSHGFLPQAEMEALVEKYQHPILKKYGEMAKEVGGHGGMDFIMDSRLVYCLQNGLPLDMDVYDLAEWCCLAELGAISMDNGCAAVAFPDFTRGEWNVTKGYKHAYASPEDENASMEKAKAFTAKLKEQGAKEWAKEAKRKKK